MSDNKYTTICFVTPWGYLSNEEALVSKLCGTPNHDGVWENIKAITDPYEADWVIGWETLDPTLDLDRIDMSKVILVGREPPWILALGDGYKYDNWDTFPEVKYKFKHALENSHLFASWTSRISYKEMKEFQWKPRNKKICVVMSSKDFCPGHRTRLGFVRKFCHTHPGVLDIYGSGMGEWCTRNDLQSHYRGCTQFGADDSKHKWISRYEYSLSFENGVLDGFFTEKFNDVMMAFTKPIFWGAKNIGSYFPESSFEYLDITQEQSVDRLYEIIQKPITEQDVAAMAASRNLIMDVWSEWPTIKRVIDTGFASPQERRDSNVSA